MQVSFTILMLILSTSICSSQVEHTLFLGLDGTNSRLKLDDTPFGMAEFIDNQLDSTPIGIRGLGLGIFEKFRLDTPVAKRLGAIIKKKEFVSIDTAKSLLIVINEFRFYNTKGQYRDENGKLQVISSDKYLKANLQFFVKNNYDAKSKPECIGSVNRFYSTTSWDEVKTIFVNVLQEGINLASLRIGQVEARQRATKKDYRLANGDDFGNVSSSRVSFDKVLGRKSNLFDFKEKVGQQLTDSMAIFQCYGDIGNTNADVVKDSLIIDNNIGLTFYPSKGSNQKRVKNCWGVFYHGCFYVRFNELYFFKLDLVDRSANFRVPDYLSDMFTLHSSQYKVDKPLNRSLRHRSYGPASPTLIGSSLSIGTDLAKKRKERSNFESQPTFATLTSYSLKYRDCRIDPISFMTLEKCCSDDFEKKDLTRKYNPDQEFSRTSANLLLSG